MSSKIITAKHLSDKLREIANPELVPFYRRFFKTGKGEYAEGDNFLGLRVPWIRKIVSQKDFVNFLPLSEIDKLLASEYHEERLGGLFVLVYRWPRATEKEKEEIYDFYLDHTNSINNWDLVDTTAPKIVGAYLYETDSSRSVLYQLAKSESLWERRIGILSTQHFIGKGESKDALQICEMLLEDEHDLIHKACGWMLREVGKKNVDELEDFLAKHCRIMPRVMLRYSLEKLPETHRQRFLYPDGKDAPSKKPKKAKPASQRKRAEPEQEEEKSKSVATRSNKRRR